MQPPDRRAGFWRWTSTGVAGRRGVSLRDVQEVASHADPRTTMRYDRARTSLDRHATYIVAAYPRGRPCSSTNIHIRLAGSGQADQWH
jgi:hypothetical protein